MLDLIYRFSRECFLTADMTRRLEGKMAILYPLGTEEVRVRTAKQLMKLYMISIILACLMIFFADISLYFTVVVCITVYSIISAYIYKEFDKAEMQLLERMLKFIDTVKFRYQFDGMLEEAILDAITECDDEMSVHGQLIYNYLRESYIRDEDIKEKQDYSEISPHHFFLSFYALCESVMKYGDKKDENGSLFVKNLGYLKEDISLEILKKKAVRGQFMGLGAMCIVPVFCIKPIELWSVSNMPELARTYDGVTGKMTTIILALVCALFYKMVQGLEYPGTTNVTKKRWVKRLMKNSVVQRMNASYMNNHIKSLKNIEKLLKQVAYPYNIAEFCVKRFVCAMYWGIMSLVITIGIGGGWFSILFAVIIGSGAYFGSLLSIKVKRQLMAMEMEDEIIRFQSIILMLMHADRITVEQILSQMERFAKCFKNQIEGIVDRLSYKGVTAFKEAKEQTDFLPFNRLLDGFIACDEMYISKAFEDVEQDRRYYIEKHKIDNNIYIEQRGAMAKFLSYIPLCAVVLAKLIVPFVIEGMNQMNVKIL